MYPGCPKGGSYHLVRVTTIGNIMQAYNRLFWLQARVPTEDSAYSTTDGSKTEISHLNMAT